jgi:hypothetical protein
VANHSMAIRKYCCDAMEKAVTSSCPDHPRRFDCPDALIDYSRRSDAFGLIVHDGGSSAIGIRFCPFCGSSLPRRTARGDRQLSSIKKPFIELLGSPCWGVKVGHGSFLTLEFGSPHLVVREPASAPMAPSRVQRVLARRSALVRGDWLLWIQHCQWWVKTNGKLIGDWTTARRSARAAAELSGQELRAVRLASRGSGAVFTFDLGSELETRPYDRSSEQWLLFRPDGRVLIWRADSKYFYGPDDTASERQQWRSLKRTAS